MQHETITTIAATVGSGVLGLALSQKTAIPSILFFLVFGILLGPEFAGLVNPAVFQENFPHYISLLVSLVLFEGGASLKTSQYRDISQVLRRLLVAGTIVTLALMAAFAHFVADLPWKQAVLLGSVLIVTGPTVVVPILQRLRVRDNVHNILKWESILIDPIGVVTAVVIFEVLILGSGSLLSGMLGFLGRFAAGSVIGLAGGWLLEQLLTRRALFRFEGEEIGSLIVVSGVILFYGLAEAVSSHAGLVTTAVIGIYLGNRTFAYKDHILHFEKKITLFSLAALFILLSSQVPVSLLRQTAFPGTMLLLVMILVARPLAVILSAGRGSGLEWKEKMFVAAFAPRGIVSASLASLFALNLARLGGEGDQFLALSFFLIVGSIVFYTATGALTAHALGVRDNAPSGLLIVGATPLSLALAAELRRRGRSVQFIDTNPLRCEDALAEQCEAFEGSGFDLDFIESLDRKGVGTMIAMTPSHEVNLLSCQAFTHLMGPGHALRLWDPTDNWDSVVSPGYDQSMGRPILVTFDPNAGGSAWAFDPKSSITIAAQTLTAPLKVTPQTLAERGLARPFFAWVNNGPLFVTPEAAIPSGAEVVCARLEDKPRPEKTGSLANRTFERFRKIYGSP